MRSSVSLLYLCSIFLVVGHAQGYDGAFEQRKIVAAEVGTRHKHPNGKCSRRSPIYIVHDSHQALHFSLVYPCLQFALEELRKTSDTGVYDSLKLLEVVNAQEEVRVFCYSNSNLSLIMYTHIQEYFTTT